jgi:DNA integrity scanning protein DisA with diadenylate cyclase activity
MRNLPPVFAAGALYDNLLQAALRQFLARATFETEPIPSTSTDGRLGIEGTDDPCALAIRWFGFRHILRVPAQSPFTVDEVQMAEAIGAVLAARYRAIFDPALMAERGDLFRGLIEDRYVGAFLEDDVHAIEQVDSRADRIAAAIEVLRVAALSSYENRPISSGLLLLGTDVPCQPSQDLPQGAYRYTSAVTSTKSFYRLSDGLHTLFLVDTRDVLLDIIDIERRSSEVCGADPLPAPCAEAYRPHARATREGGHVCLVLSPSHEIKVFARGVQKFTFRHGAWQLLDLEAKYRRWLDAVGDAPLADRLFQAALDLADAREGALFVVLREPEATVGQLVAATDRLDMPAAVAGSPALIRRELLYLVANRNIRNLDASVLFALARIDGAVVVGPAGRLLAAGAILLHPPEPAGLSGWVGEGARTTAAQAASRFGPVLKVSEDGIISMYDGDRLWDL